MKKLLCLITSAFILLMAGCSQAADDSVVLPPSRVGKNIGSASLEKSYTFETAFAEADAVARIKVGNWLNEDNEIHSTYFDATVLQCFKGDMPERFVLKQDGSSELTMEGYPLFTYGEELLVFLNDGSDADNKALYWIIGAFTTVMDVYYDAEGTRYYTDSRGILGETMDISTNYARINNTASEIFAAAASANPLIVDVANEWISHSYIFSEADMISFINSLQKI